MDSHERIKNLKGCLHQTNKRLDSLIIRVKTLEDLAKDDYLRINKRLNELESPPRKWWQRIKFEL